MPSSLESDPAVYLDHAATTHPFDDVLEAVEDVSRQRFGNPSSQHRFGAAARHLLEDAREFLRGSLGAARLVFTSGGTEADLLGIVGAAAARAPGRVLVAASDHPAVLATRAPLALRRHELCELPVTPHGDLEPERLFDALGRDVRVVSILHGHNELGTLARLDELVGTVRHVAPDAHVHVDLVQSYGKVDFDLDLAGVDSVAISGHKLHGPRGIGALALSSTAKLAPLQLGGGQEDGLRGGTENVPGAVGLARAAERMLTQMRPNATHTAALATRFVSALQQEFGDLERLGHPERRLPHLLSLRIPGVVGQTLQERCDARGIAFSTGSACHDGAAGDNHVLRAIGLSSREAREVVRISFACDTTPADCDRAVAVLIDEVETLRALAPSRADERLRP